MKKPPKAKTNRDAIIEAALAGFIETGFHQTGIRDIAKRAGVSLGNLYNHFSGKDALIAEIARIEAEDIDQMLANLPNAGSPMDAVCALATAILHQHSRPENAILTADLTSEAMRNPVVADVFAANGARIDEALSGLIRDGIKRGEILAPVPVVDCVALIRDAAQSSGVRAAFEGSSSVRAATKALDVMIRRLLANHTS